MERPPGAGTMLTKRKPTKACDAPAAAAADGTRYIKCQPMKSTDAAAAAVADAEPVSVEQENQAGSASPATALGLWRWFVQESS